jgi:hypothetical protein
MVDQLEEGNDQKEGGQVGHQQGPGNPEPEAEEEGQGQVKTNAGTLDYPDQDRVGNGHQQESSTCQCHIDARDGPVKQEYPEQSGAHDGTFHVLRKMQELVRPATGFGVPKPPCGRSYCTDYLPKPIRPEPGYRH